MDYINIGKIVATHGIQGELILKHALSKKADFKGVEVFFIEETKDAYIPYFIEKVIARTNVESLVKIEKVASKEAANRFIKKNVWLLQEDFAKIADDQAPIALMDYLVINEQIKLGRVLEVIEQPHQILLRILYLQKEVYIPIHEETLDKIDRKNREIHVSLPDGLLDVYLES